MRKFVIELGIFFLTIILFVIPILTTCAFIYRWNSLIIFILCIASCVDFIAIFALIAHLMIDESDL